MGSVSAASVVPLAVPADSGINFGAAVENVDIENLTGKISLCLS